MRRRIIKTLSAFKWQQWLVAGMFCLVLLFTAFQAVRISRGLIYWDHQQDEPIRGWMSIGYVAHSHRVPPHVLCQALGLPPKPPDRRPLRDIARSQRRSMDEVRAILQHAIINARPPHSPPPPPDDGGKR